MKKFEELTEREVLALAIALEEEDERVYADFAEGLRPDYPASAAMFEGMREEESGHRRRLIELFRQKFGEHIPLIRRQDVRGFVERPALWLIRPLRIEAVRKEASTMEVETRRFYEKAAQRTQDASVRQLLDDLINEEREHEERAQELDKEKLPANVKADEERAQRRLFVLQIVQPGLAGLWTVLFPRWHLSSRPRLPQQTVGMLFEWASLPRREPASAWDSPRRSPMMGASRGVGIPGCAV